MRSLPSASYFCRHLDNVWECLGMSRMCDVIRQAVQMCGSPSHPVNDRHSTWPGAWHLRGSNLNVQHISSYFVIFQRHRTSCSHPFPAHPILLVPSKSFEHPQSSGLLGSAIVRWHVVTSPCQSEGEPVRICQNWQAGSTPVWLPVPKALLAAKLLERLLPWI